MMNMMLVLVMAMVLMMMALIMVMVIVVEVKQKTDDGVEKLNHDFMQCHNNMNELVQRVKALKDLVGMFQRSHAEQARANIQRHPEG